MIADRTTGQDRVIPDLFLPMFGEHNVQNSLTVIAIAEEMGLGDDVVRATLRNFKGVRRRFTKTGEWNGVSIIDDYGHHPVEIAAVLKAARAIALGRVIAVVQPHRYTRLANLFDGFCTCFNDADAVLVADVYAAGEAPIDGISRDALVAGLTAHGHRNARLAARPARPRGDRCAIWRGPATSSCASAPARSPTGPTRCPTTSPPRPAESGRVTSGLLSRLPPPRGRLTADAPIGPLTWFRVGGPAEVLFRPADADDLAEFLARNACGHSGHRDRCRLEPPGARRRHSRRGGAAGARLRRHRG